MTKVPATIKLGSDTSAEFEWSFKGAAATKLTASTNLASLTDISNLKLKKTVDFTKWVKFSLLAFSIFLIHISFDVKI